MKVLSLCIFIAIAVMASPSQALLGDLIGSIQNGISSTINSINSAINIATFGGQFLWDNAFNPALQTLTTNGANFIDNYFGGLLNAIGKRDVDQFATMAQKEIFLSNYLAQMATLTSGLREIFFQILEKAKTQLIAAAAQIFTGQVQVKDILKKLIQEAQQAMMQLISTVQASIMKPLSTFRMAEANSQELEVGVGRIIDTITNGVTQAINYLTSLVFLGYTNLSNLIG